MSNLTHERLSELLTYDPLTGEFRWRPKLRKNKNKEGVAGTINSRGYQQITIDYVIYLSHRLAWFYMKGTWPSKIDHRDENKLNNIFDNLRETTPTQNNGNTTLTKPRAKGLRGTQQYGKKFQAYITFQGKSMHLGMHDTVEQAHEAYKKKHLELHGEFSIYHERKPV